MRDETKFTWPEAIACGIKDITCRKGSATFTMVELKEYIPEMFEKVGSEGRTPTNTVHKALQIRFRDTGVLAFVDNLGTYRVLDPEGLDDIYRGKHRYASAGEETVARCLKELEIAFVAQKTFRDLRDQRLLRLDFHIEKEKTAIEVDSPIHWDSADYRGGDEALALVQKHDAMKDTWCRKNGTKMIRIKSDSYDEIMGILMEEFGITERPPKMDEEKVVEVLVAQEEREVKKEAKKEVGGSRRRSKSGSKSILTIAGLVLGDDFVELTTQAVVTKMLRNLRRNVREGVEAALQKAVDARKWRRK